MRRFTKSVLTLLCLMVGSVNAFADEEIALTQAMFQTWNGYGADAVATGAATVDFNIGNDAEIAAGGMVCGTGTVDYLTYADLSGSSKLIIEGTAGLALRVLMNRQESNNGPLVEKNPTIGENGKVELDLTDLTYVHINAIKVGWGSPAGKVNSIKFVKPSDPLAVPKEALKKVIDQAKLYSSIAMTEASFAVLTQAISDGEAALADAGATSESLTNAATAITNAIDGLTFAEGFSSLKDVAFGSWNGWGADAEMTQPGTPAWTLFEATGQPYGDPSVNAYADVSAFDKLYIVAVSGSPRILLNRDADNGQWSETESESHLIDNTKGGWSAKYFAQNENVYTVDLKQLVADKGFAHLTSIKGANYANVTVTGMYLYKAPEVQPFEPAYGTIWENGETTTDGDYTLISLNKGYFQNFAKVADTLKVDFEVVAAARAARNIKKGEISFWAGTDELFSLANIMPEVKNVDIVLTEEMITKLAAAEQVTLKYKNMAVAKVALVEKVVPPFEPTDVTAKVNKAGWQSAVGNVGNYGDQKEQYLTNTTTNGEILYQTVEGLDNGTYTVEIIANASYTAGRSFASAALDGEIGRVVVYAGDVEKTIPVVYQTAVGTNNVVTLENVVVTDGTLKMGLRKDIEGSNWHTIQIQKLMHVSLEANADAAAQDEYWKGVAATVAAYEAYANVAGSEKAAIAAAETKAAAQAAIAPFYAAKASYDALVDVINKGKSVDLDMTEAEALLTNAETTAAQAAEKAAELVHAVTLAVNTKKVEGATAENPIVTDFVINGTFDQQGVTAPWKTTTNAQNQTTANNQQGAFTGYFFENWNGSAFTGKIYQEIEDIPNGNYTLKIAAFVNNFDASAQYVYANASQTALTTGEPTAYEVNTVVVDNKIEIGLEQISAVANWMGIDNVSLVYTGATDLSELVQAYNDALAAAQAVEGRMNVNVKAALDAAIAAQVDMDNADSLGAATAALVAATTAAKASVAAYAKAGEVLPKMKEITESTNVYTAEAYENYYAKWAAAYNVDTLTTAEANALQDPFLVTGWHAAITVDNFLLSAWDTEADKFQGYYINSWSNEGGNDGTGFVVPFFEYWTDDANSLGEKTLTATMNGLTAGDTYEVTALVRVRMKNGAEAPAFGISLQANEGNAVDVCAGDAVENSQFFLKEFTAEGVVAEDGVLKIKFNIAADNNVSWLSFKNVVFAKKTIEVAHTWNFTKWSEATVANLKAEAAKGMTEGLWSDAEKADGSAATMEISKDNCFWQVGTSAADGEELTANGEVIAELKGLKFKNNKARSLAIAVNYGDCTSANGDGFGPYYGASYLWLGSKNVEYFTIPAVLGGTTIKMGVESHKLNDARGVQLFAGETELKDANGDAVAAPTTYTEQTWVVPEGKNYDIVVKNTNGCHIYFIDAEQDPMNVGISAVKNSDRLNGVIYNLNGQKVNKAQKGLYIIDGKKMFVK
ncbi:MAG: hypothetical protein K6F89_02515 [Prevotella sp.]|nr:hypothetical protein [Prevotella sp.]